MNTTKIDGNINDQIKAIQALFPGKRVIAVDYTRAHVLEPEAAEAKIKRFLVTGRSVTTEDGITRWIERQPFFNPRATLPSERYTWHADGNRVKAAKFLVSRQSDGSVRKKRIGYGWTTP